MADADSGNQGDDKGGATRSFRRGVFPRASLSSVLELVSAIAHLGHGDPVPRLDVYDYLHRKDSGSTRTLVAAANSGYGLTTGNSGSEVLGLADPGLAIANAKDDANRLKAILDALMANEIYASLVEKYAGKSIPSDGAVTYFLQKSHGLSPEEASACWKVMKDNLEHYGPHKMSSGTLHVVSPEEALASASKAEAQDQQDEVEEAGKSALGGGEIRPPEGSKQPPHGNVERLVKGGLQPQFHFNIQVVLPENATPETYEAIFRSIGDNLLYRSDD